MGSAQPLPGSYTGSKLTSCISITHFSMRGGNLAVALLNIGNKGLCEVMI